MMNTSSKKINPEPNNPSRPSGLKLEVTIVFTIQMALILILVLLDKFIALGGGLHAMVGIVFIILPVLVLDKRGKPYDRYGLNFGKPGVDLLWALGAMAVTFTPIVLFICYVAPWVWGVEDKTWSFTWPKGYPEVMVSHLAIVALPEEFFYRGYLMGRLNDIFDRKFNLFGTKVGPSLPISAALFAVGHFLVDFSPARLLVFFPALAFGWLKEKRGSIVTSVIYHAACNIFMGFFRAGFGLN